ncbi:fimbrial protein [Erwinia sp. AnSW2-5]|uniref:fimbrial protein n=1 Tax=Erwinia sp. AnSW2-5 TaxID=3367692 RepID=UPI00385E0CCB
MREGICQPGLRPVKRDLRLLLMLLMAPFAEASQESLILFDVTIVAPVCVVNDNKPIDVNFGSDVKISHIGRGDYKLVPVTFSLKCERGGNYNLVVQGAGADFDSEVLATNTSDLGVEFIINNKRNPINRAVLFKYPSLPLIYARPVVSNVKRPLAGDFSATASLQVIYD